MQTPSSADPSFKAFLSKLQEQNNRGFLVQLLQLKAENEIAGEDADKREEQLEEANTALKEVKSAVTGLNVNIDITPLVNIGENQTRLLEELSRESALTRKLTEGSVEYDKAAAQYRNLSGREIESVVSGKTSKKGGFLDFETARSSVAGQSGRVREANAIKLKTIDYVPGSSISTVSNSTVTNKDFTNNSSSITNNNSRNFFQYLGEEIISGIKYIMTDGLSEQNEKKDRTFKVSSARQKPVSANPEADNIATSQEVISETAKTDLQITRNILDASREQLTELKVIRVALAPSTPKELTEQRSKAVPETSTIEPNVGLGIPSLPSIHNKPSTPTPRKVPAAASAALTAGTLATVAVGGAAATYAATGMLAAQEEHRKAYSAEQDKLGLLSAMSGDTGIAATILDANEGKPVKEVQAAQAKERKALENAPWYTKYYGIGKSDYLKANPLPVEGVGAEQAQVARSDYAAVDPRRVDMSGRTVASTSTENIDMNREAIKGGAGGNTIVSNNVNSTNTTKYVPLKASPRPEFSGSALDRYQSRITVY